MKVLSNIISHNNIFIIFAMLLISGCTKFGVPIGEVNTNEVKPPDMEFFDFSRESYTSNMRQSFLIATNAQFYTKSNIIHLYDGRGYTYKETGEVDASGEALFSIINDKTLFAELYTNVVVKASNDTILYTEYLEYDNKNKKLTTPEHIRAVQEDGSWLTGVGMNADLDFEYITIYNETDEGNSFGVNLDSESNGTNK